MLVESFQECGFSIFIDNVFITMEVWPRMHKCKSKSWALNIEIVDLFIQPNLYQLPEKFELFKASGYYKGYYLMICLSLWAFKLYFC